MKTFGIIVFFTLLASLQISQAYATDTTFSGNYAVPETQSGFQEEQYEAKASQKLLRGLQNFVLSPLEIPQGVKSEIAYRKSEYLPTGIETVAVGIFRGFGNGVKRWGVGVYEIFTFPYPQDPILSEFHEWLY